MSNTPKTAEQRLAERLERDGVYTYPVDVPIPAGNRRTLEAVAFSLRRSLDGGDCYCGDGDKNYTCDHCHGVESLRELERMLNPEHRTVNPDRLGNPAEAIYLQHWRKQQETSPHVNNGVGTLEAILTPTRQTQGDGARMWIGSAYYHPMVSQRDAEVAASVVQWLGTNCGGAFVFECERMVKAAREAVHDYERRLSMAIQGREPVADTVDAITRQVVSHFHRADGVKFQEMYVRVRAAIEVATDKYRQAAEQFRAVLSEGLPEAGAATE